MEGQPAGGDTCGQRHCVAGTLTLAHILVGCRGAIDVPARGGEIDLRPV